MNKIKLYFNYLTMFFSLIIPKKKNRWIFGAWFGNRISDNPYAFYRYMEKNHPETELIWIGNSAEEAEKFGVNFVKRDSWKGIRMCLTAKVCVMNQSYLDVASFNWIRRSYKLQLWHGVPWKKIGEDTKDEKTGFFHRISHATYLKANRCDLYIGPCDDTAKAVLSAFRTTEEHVLKVGQPRNEILMKEEECKAARARILPELGSFDKVIVYMPTFRDGTEECFSLAEIGDKIIPALEEANAVILEKQHYVAMQRGSEAGAESERILNVKQYDSQELLAMADILVTDYSSCFFDFILRDKPMIHFLYDYDRYRKDDRGLYYDKDYVTAGCVAEDKETLASELAKILRGKDEYVDRRHLIRDRFATYESVLNSEKIYQRVSMDINK